MQVFYFIESFSWNELLGRDVWTPEEYFNTEHQALKALEIRCQKDKGTYKISKIYTSEDTKPNF